MRCSANEIFHTVRKALIGCGISHDIAEDVGYGCLMAQMAGADCLLELCALLDLFAGNSAANPAIADPKSMTLRAERLHLDCRGGDLLLRGAAICDWLIAHPDKPSVVLATDRLARFFVGQLVFLGCQYGGVATIEDTTSARAWQAEQLVSIKMPTAALFSLTYHSLHRPATFAGVKLRHSEVDAAVWRQLTAFAQRTYVPESQQSRLSGAGAALSDND